VHSELKIEDTVAQRFSESFYWQLFEGKTIEEAFRHARAAIAGKDVYTCCCAHSHKPNCEWYKMMKNEGYEKAHHAHTPTCTDCFNKFGNKFEHKEDCMWAVDFLTLVCGHDELPEHQIHACCCSPELPHNEVMKFKLICKDEKFAKQVLWKHREKGTVSIKSTYSSTETKFSTAKITGRNRETYEIFSFLTSKEVKIVNLYGLDGVGKTTLAKQVGNYLAERGFFRDKMAILMLEKTPSITYFRANLFKEITGSYDLKTFCESINTSKMLFILLKCDSLIKDNYDGFRQDLSYVMEYAPNVKFLIVTQNKADLKIGESTVLMKELKKLDAAKLLVKNAYMYLPWDLRNVYNLVQHDVFDLIPLTPQGIWAVSEKLKNNKTLDEIERELAIEKEKYEENLPTVEMEETVVKILHKIKEEYFDAYYVILCICLYPSGLSFTDMEEMAAKGRITTSWKEILYSFLRTKSLCNQYCSQVQKEDGGVEPKPECPIAKDMIERQGKPIERSDFKPDNYIWLNITKEPSGTEIWFVPTQFIIKIAEKYLTDCFAKQTLKKFEYMAIMSTSLINKIKKNYNYLEKLVEFSSVSSFGIWRLPAKGEMCMLKDANLIQYIDKCEYDFDKLKRWFSLHESNLFSCFDPDAIDRLVTNKNINNDCVLELMEILCLAIPTLFKIISPRGTGAMEAARRAEQILNKFTENNFRVSIIRIKLSLFLAALHMSAKNDVSENFTLAKIQLKLTQEEVEKVKTHECAPLLFAVVAIGFAYYFYKGYKKNCLNPKEFPNKQAVNTRIDSLFKKIEFLAAPILKTDETLKVAKAKISLMRCKTRNPQAGLEKQLLEDMREAVIVLTEYKSLRLIMKAHYLYAGLKIEIEKKKMAMQRSENTAENIRIMTNRLVEIKYVHLIKTALDIAKKIKDKCYEAKIKKKIDEINMEIRQKYFNVINIMRAAPIIDIQPGLDNTVESVPVGFPTRLASVYKHELIDALSEANKVLCMKFGLLTRKELIEAVHSGCRVLQLNCTYTEDNCLCVETEFGVVDRITFSELRQIFTPKVCCNSSPKPITMPSLPEDAAFESELLPKVNACKAHHNKEDIKKLSALPEDAKFESELLPKVNACKAHHNKDDIKKLSALPEDATFESELLPKVNACKAHHAKDEIKKMSALPEDANFESELLPKVNACKAHHNKDEVKSSLPEDAAFEKELLPKINACKAHHTKEEIQKMSALPEDANFESELLPKVNACKAHHAKDEIKKMSALPEDANFESELLPKVNACKAHHAREGDVKSSLPEDAAFEKDLLPKINACKAHHKKSNDSNHEEGSSQDIKKMSSLPEDANFEAELLPKTNACKLQHSKTFEEENPQEMSTNLSRNSSFQASLLPKTTLAKAHTAMHYRTRGAAPSESPDEEDEEKECVSTIQHPPVQEGGKIVDVLLLGVKNNRNLAELFVSLKVPHIITFEFLNVEIDFRHKVYEDECIDMFSLYFYQELIAQKSIYDAFEAASVKVFEYLGEKFFEGKPQSYITQIIGKGPVLLPEGADHSEVLFGPGRFPLANGRIEDISNSTYPTNIEKMYIPYTGRRKDFYGIIPKLVQTRGFFELTGAPGVGKTAFALHVGYFILNRDIFTDGVFYIPLKTLREKSFLGYQMKDLLRDTLGIDVQFGFLSQLKGKNMLLIFDDFDLLYDDEIEYCRLFFRAVKQCKIACIAITTRESSSDPQKTPRIMQRSHEREQEINTELLSDKDLKWELQGLIERDFLLMLQAFIKPEDDRHSITVDELKTIEIVQQCEGNPKLLLDCLIGGKIKLGEKVLEINPLYKEELEFEEHYTNNLELLSMPSVHYSRFISTNSDFRNYTRGLSKIEPDFHHHTSSMSSIPGLPGLRRGSYRSSFGKNSDDSGSDYHKTRSMRLDNSDYLSDLTLIKNLSSIGGNSGYPPLRRMDRHHPTRPKKHSNDGILGALTPNLRVHSTSSGDASTTHMRTPGGASDKAKNGSMSNVDAEEERNMIALLRSPELHSEPDLHFRENAALVRTHSNTSKGTAQPLRGNSDKSSPDTSNLRERKESNFTISNKEDNSLMEEDIESSGGEEEVRPSTEGELDKENEWDNNIDVDSSELEIRPMAPVARQYSKYSSASSNLENKGKKTKVFRRLGRPMLVVTDRKRGTFKPQKYGRMVYEQKD